MRSYAHGGILIITLVILAVFVVMAMAAAALVNRQFHEVAGQEQEEQAFQIAEAGVDYATWLLDQGLVDFANPQPITDYEVTDHTQDPPEVLGTFTATFETIQYTPPGGPAVMRVVSVGKDTVLVNRTQTIEAVIQSEVDPSEDEPEDKLELWRVIEWDHKP